MKRQHQADPHDRPADVRLRPVLAAAKKGLAALLMLVICISGLIWYRQQPVILRLGVFSGSAWDVPSPKSSELIDRAIEQFEKENPGVQVKYTSGIMKEDYAHWLANRVAGGETPDVFMILPEDFDLYCSIGALRNLDNQMAMSQVSKDSLYSSALQGGQYHREQFALPFESNVELLFVNKTLLKKENIELPKQMSLEDFAQICRQVTQDTNQDGWIDQFGICDYTWKQAADAYGVELFSEDGLRVSLSGDDFGQAIAYASDLAALCQDVRSGSDPFSSGQAAFAVMSFADYRTYTPYPWKIKRLSAFDWDVIPLPGRENSLSEVDTIQMAVSSASRHPDASWKLLETLCLNPQIQSLHYTYSQGISPLKHAVKPLSEDSEVDFSILETVMNKPVRKAHFSNYASALELVDQAVSPIAAAGYNQNILLMQAEEKINRELNQP